MADPALNVLPEISSQPQRIKEFFLARQPILDREQNLFAYELLFRSTAAGPANVTHDLAATASVIAHAAELGMENVIGASLAFINVDAAVLLSDFILCLPKDKVVLEILETVKVTDRLTARIEELAAEGYVFALDDVVLDTESVERLLPLVDIIKVEISSLDGDALRRLSQKFRRSGKKLLAEKVESREQFEDCLALGFDFFQGYYFAKPFVMTGKILSPSQTQLMRLMAQVVCDAETVELEQCIEQDFSLGVTLLRLVNTPMTGMTQADRRIESIGEALDVIERGQLQRWLQVLLYAELGRSRGNASALLMLATTRSRLLELMAQKMQPRACCMPNLAFTVGMLSLMDALLDLPMQDILAHLPVTDEVKQALLSRTGLYGDMLKLVEGIEQMKDAGALLPILTELGISGEELYSLQLEAFEWSESISRTTKDPEN